MGRFNGVALARDVRVRLTLAPIVSVFGPIAPAWASYAQRAAYYYLAASQQEERINQAVEQQAKSADALKDRVSTSVTDPAVRHAIEQAIQEYTSRADHTIALSLEAFRREAESKERYATAMGGSLVVAAVAILALIFRWPLLDRKLKKLEIAERQRALRDRDAPPE